MDPWLSARLPLLEGLTTADRDDPDADTQRRMDAFLAPLGSWQAPRAEVEERSADGVGVRVYRPPSPSGCGLVWMHGGGFAGGDLDMGEADGVARELAARAGAVVVSASSPTPLCA